MSRCFPFPPPGYEKTPRPDGQLDSHLLDKEKHKEKKHKKDKKDKEKKEGKDKKDKERSKDKHRDKKDRKEKHKEKKKDKSKDKSRGSEEGTEKHGEALRDQKFAESSRKSEEVKDPKFREDVVRKTQDEKEMENRVSIERSRESFSAAPALENERTAANKMHINSFNTSRKNEGAGQQSININQQKNGTSIRHGENFNNSSSQRTPGGSITASPMEDERVKVKRPLSSSTDSVPKKEGIGQRINNISILVQKRIESPNKEITNREIGTSSSLLPSAVNTMHKGNGKVGRPIDNAPVSVQRFDSPSTSSAATGMDRGIPRSTIPNPSITIRRPNGMVRPPESLPISTKKPGAGGLSPAMGKEKEPAGRMLQNNVSTDQKMVHSKNPVVDKVAAESLPISTKKPGAGGLSPAMGKEKEPAGRMLQNSVSTDQKLVHSKNPVVDKVAAGRVERMEVRDGALGDAKKEDRKEKVRDRVPDDPKKEDRKRDRHEKKKRKEKDKHKEKKKEKEAKEKEEHNYKEDDKRRESNINCQVDSVQMKPLAPPLAPRSHDVNAILADENLKKRKNHEVNGYLQNHHDMRPTKLLRPAPSSSQVENGTASHVAVPLSSTKPDAINIEKAERFHKKEENINGNKDAQRPSADSGLRDPQAAAGNGTTSRKLPHPDCKYLRVIYSIPDAPQMMECGHDEQDWLLSTQSDRPKSATEADGAPQVWAQAVKIDSADIIALPYVIPF